MRKPKKIQSSPKPVSSSLCSQTVTEHNSAATSKGSIEQLLFAAGLEVCCDFSAFSGESHALFDCLKMSDPDAKCAYNYLMEVRVSMIRTAFLLYKLLL